VISKLAHCSAGDDQTVDKYLPRQLGKKTTVVHLALLAAGNCEPHDRLPLVQLTVLPQTDYFPVVAIVLGVYRDGVSTFNDREKAVEGTIDPVKITVWIQRIALLCRLSCSRTSASSGKRAI
jgi:hypothetical protein